MSNELLQELIKYPPKLDSTFLDQFNKDISEDSQAYKKYQYRHKQSFGFWANFTETPIWVEGFDYRKQPAAKTIEDIKEAYIILDTKEGIQGYVENSWSMSWMKDYARLHIYWKDTKEDYAKFKESLDKEVKTMNSARYYQDKEAVRSVTKLDNRLRIYKSKLSNNTYLKIEQNIKAKQKEIKDKLQTIKLFEISSPECPVDVNLSSTLESITAFSVYTKESRGSKFDARNSRIKVK